MTRRSVDAVDAWAASREELAALLESSDPDILLAAIENPLLTEKKLCELLERKDLPAELLARVTKNREWMKGYPVRLRLARHPRTPRLATLALLRQLFLFDLVGVSLLPSVPAEMRRLAEDLILNRLPQLPLGQRLTLARRGPTRVAAALAAEGLPQVLPLALDNAFLTEGQLLKMLAKADLPPRVVAAIADHRKWSYNANVRIALVRNPLTPLARVMTFLPDIPLHHLRDLSKVPTLRADLKKYLEHEVDRRLGRKRQ
jgi:hypothetical protein